MILALLACKGEEAEPPVSNNPPVIASLEIQPDPAFAADTITAVPSVVELDGDTFTLGYTWWLDGVELSVEEASLPPFTAVHGQELKVEVTVGDAFAFGAPAEASVILSNSTPVIDAVAIDPPAPQVGQALACAVESHDDDGEALTTTITWSVDDVIVEDPGTDLPRNTEVWCEAIVDDGELGAGPVRSATVYIGNSPPGTPTIALDPDPPTACLGGEVRVTAEAIDPDGDPITYEYAWKDEGGGVLATTSVIGPAVLTARAPYTVEVTAFDGKLRGPAAVIAFTAVQGGEAVGNGIDDDCDGLVDEWVERTWQAQQLWWDDTAQAQAGFTLGAGDLDGDGRDDLALARNGEGDLVVFLGSSMDPAQPVLPGPDLVLTGAPASNQVELGDADGDGLADLLVGVPGHDGAAADAGAVFLVLGADLAAADLEDLASWSVSGAAKSRALGGALDLGDLDGDGYDDPVVGDPIQDAPAREAGRVTVYASTAGTVNFDGGVREAHFGTSVAVLGDIDGDGVAELGAGAPDTDDNGVSSGSLGVWFSLGGGYLSAADWRVDGSTDSAYLGREPASAADIDGDGLAELAVGSEESTSLHMPGTVSIYRGSDQSLLATVQGDVADAWLGLYGPGPLLGQADGTGGADLLVGAAGEGSLYLWRGEDLVAGGTFTPADANIALAGEDPATDNTGRWLRLADTDGDGVQDLVATAPKSSTLADRGGALYVLRPPFGQPAEAWSPDCEERGGALFCRVPKSAADAELACAGYGRALAAPDAALGAAAAGFYPVGPERGRWWVAGACTALNVDGGGLTATLDCAEELFFVCE